MHNKSGELKQLVLFQIQETRQKLSTRAQNVIQSLIRFNPSILFDYVYGFEQIILIRNVGKKTQLELQGYFEEIKRIVEKDFQPGESTKNLNVIKTKYGVILEEELDEKIKYEEIVETFFQTYKNYLSNRAIHAIENLLNSNFHTFLEYVFSIKEIKSIRNIGTTTVPELELFFKSVRQFIDDKNTKNIDPNFLNLKLLFSNIPKIQSFLFSKEEALRKNQFPIYSFYKILISEGHFLSKKENHILLRYYGILGTKKGTRAEIASELALSNERVRQLLKKINTKLVVENTKFSEKYPKLFSCDNYNQLFDKEYFFIDNEFRDKVNTAENESFTLDDIEFLTSLVTRNKYTEINFCQLNVPDKMFIRNDLTEIFRFSDFISDFHLKINTKYNSTLELSFEGYLYSFLIRKNFEELKKISSICEKIAFKYFGKIVSIEGIISFESSKNDLQIKIREVFQEFKTPLKVKEIERVLLQRYPETKITELKVRSVLQRFDEFEHLGMSSTYFLKAWENEIPQLKGGTIREIVFKLLLDKKKPLKVDYVIKHVLKYRNSNRSSIMSNLKVDSKKRFIFQKNGMIELRGR